MAQPKDMFTSYLPKRIAEKGESLAGVGAVFLFKITGEGGGEWTVNLKDQLGVTEGDAGNAECTIECTADDWTTIQTSPQSAMQLYFEGRLKVGGNAMLATRLSEILG